MTLLTAWKFHRWALERFLAVCQELEPEALTKDLGNSFPSIRDTLVHCFMADHAWFHRVQGLAFTRPEAQNYPSVQSIIDQWQPFLEQWETLITRSSLEQIIVYKTFDGAEFNNSFEEITRHVVNHGSYHRGQIAMMLRLLGHKPPATDWILYSRISQGQTQ